MYFIKFGVISLQIDNTFILADKTFVKAEQEKFKFKVKSKEMLSTDYLIKFNGGIITLTGNVILITQE